MLHTLRFSLQNAVYFIMTPIWFLYYSYFTYKVCKNLNVKLRCQKVNNEWERPNKTQLLKSPVGHRVQLELLLMLVKKSWRQKAMNREAWKSVINMAIALKTP
jgi:hypothetical protein